MATKTAIERSEERFAGRQEPNAVAKFVEWVREQWNEFTGFLRDVRAETKKVVAPTWKEVRATTGVVIVAVLIFGAYFFIVDNIFGHAVRGLLNRLGGGLQ